MPDAITNNSRIAKNTLLLYCRTLVIMLITLYTSRIIINALGVEDYGIYNVVGGVVAMFSMLSGSMSNAISRFITFELGRGDRDRLISVFSTSVTIQIILSVLILLLGVSIGRWFLNAQMNIPNARLSAANWVLYCSLLVFCINLISIPYNACIIAHERMSAFAYISILEAVLKLFICYMVIYSPFDKLMTYCVLLLCTSLVIRGVYGWYCSKHFFECHYRFSFDRSMLKEMTGFAGWTFISSSCWIFNTQGINILINIFFGVTLNAARGIATQVDAAIQQLVNNFTTAVNPQIIKNYASGQKEAMFSLVCRGAKFSYFLLLIIALPVFFNANYLLHLWLGVVPAHTVVFLRLTLIGSMISMLGITGTTACWATGHVKRYSLWISSIGFLLFPLTWIAFALGFPVETTYILFILIYIGVDVVRLYIMKSLMGFPPGLFVREVVVKILLVTPLSVLPIALLFCFMEESFLRLIMSVGFSCLFTSMCVYLIGFTANERLLVRTKVKERLLKLRKNCL